MPKIPMSGRQVVPSGRAGAERMSHYPQPGRRAAQQTQRFGQTLQRIGGQFADIALKLAKIDIENDILKSKIDFGEAHKAEWERIQQEEPHDKWEEAYGTWFDQETKTNIAGLKTPRAKEDQARYFRQQRLVQGTMVGAAAGRVLVAETRANLNVRLDQLKNRYADTRDPEERQSIVQEVGDELATYDANIATIGPEQVKEMLMEWGKEAEALRLRREYNEAARVAEEILYEKSKVMSYRQAVKETQLEVGKMKHLLPNQRHSIERHIEWEGEFIKNRDREIKKQESALSIDADTKTMTQSLTNPNMRLDVETIRTDENRLFKDAWIAIGEGQNKAEPEKTDFAEYNRLEEGVIFDYWDGKLTKDDVQTQICSARWADRKLINQHTGDLLKRIEWDIPGDQRAYLRMAFKANQRELSGDASLRTNRALMIWTMDQVGRKKSPDLATIYQKSMELRTDEAASLRIGQGPFLPDDVRLYVEPPSLKGKIDNWMELSEGTRRNAWFAFYTGKYTAEEILTAIRAEK